MSQVNLNAAMLSIFLLAIGCSSPGTGTGLPEKSLAIDSREARLGSLITFELDSAHKEVSLPRFVVLKNECTDISNQALHDVVLGRLKTMDLTLVKAREEDYVLVNVLSFSDSGDNTKAKLSLRWGPRKGYVVELEDRIGNTSRSIVSRQ